MPSIMDLFADRIFGLCYKEEHVVTKTINDHVVPDFATLRNFQPIRKIAYEYIRNRYSNAPMKKSNFKCEKTH